MFPCVCKHVATSAVLVLLLVWTAGCREYRCPSFDTGHAVNTWNWFPGSLPHYTFRNDQDQTLVLERAEFEQSEARSFRCHMCACLTRLDVNYRAAQQDGFTLTCALTYLADADPANPDPGSLYYGVDKASASFEPSDRDLKDPGSAKDVFDVVSLSQLQLLHSSYRNAVQLTLKDSSKSSVRRLWVVPGAGLVGFQYGGVVWERQ